MTKITLTHKALYSQFRENTGISFLDSGGYPKYDENGNYVGSTQGYGRGYERLANVTIEQMIDSPIASIEVWKGDDWYISINTFQWLSDRLELSPELTNSLLSYGSKADNQELPWLRVMENWVNEYLPSKGFEVRGIYGDGEPYTDNTYNGECLLSTTLQFAYFTLTDHKKGYNPFCGESYVCLQTHNGADVRGGYSSPKVYREKEETSFLSWNNATLACQVDYNHYFDTDDGYNFRSDNNDCNDLKKLPTMPIEEYKAEFQDNHVMVIDTRSQLQLEGLESHKEKIIIADKTLPDPTLVFDCDNNKLYCPICAKQGILSRLEAFWL